MPNAIIVILLLLPCLAITKSTDMSDTQVQVFAEQICPEKLRKSEFHFSDDVMILNASTPKEAIVFIKKDDDNLTRFVAFEDNYYTRVDNCYYMNDPEHAKVQTIGAGQVVLDRAHVTKYVRYELDHQLETLMKSKGCDNGQVKTSAKLNLEMNQGVVTGDDKEDVFIIRFERIEYFNSFIKSLPLQDSLESKNMNSAFHTKKLCLNPLIKTTYALNNDKNVLVEKIEVSISLKHKWKESTTEHIKNMEADPEQFMTFHKKMVGLLVKMLKDGVAVEESPLEDSYIDTDDNIIFLFLKIHSAEAGEMDTAENYFSTDLGKFIEQNMPANVNLPRSLLDNYTYCLEHLNNEFGEELMEHEKTEELFGFVYSFLSKALAKDADFESELKDFDKLIQEYKNTVIDQSDKKVVSKIEKTIKDKGSRIIGGEESLNDIYDQISFLMSNGAILAVSWIILSAF